jgi:hypothetical protein
MSETTELTGPLVKMIRETGTFVLRLNSGKVKVRGGWMQLCPEGTADIVCFPKGAPVWLETKAVKRDGHKAQREAQDAFRERVEQLGHKYVLVRTIEEGINALQ